MKNAELLEEIKKINARLDRLENNITNDNEASIDNISWVEVSIDNLSWAEISNCKTLIEVGDCKNLMRVGDYKNVTLKSGEEVKVYVANLNPLRFIFAIDGEYRMNDTDTNEGGWDKCKMKNVTMRHLWNLLPDDMKEYIVEHDGDLLSLMSQEEYESFDIFKDKTLRDLFEGHYWYWLKDTYLGNSSLFYGVDYDGSINPNIAHDNGGVSACFAIK